MSEEFWSALLQHLIQAVMTLGLAAIAAVPTIILGWLKLRELGEKTRVLDEKTDLLGEKTDRNARLTKDVGTQAQIIAENATVAAEKSAAAVEVAINGKHEITEAVQVALDRQTAELKDAIKKNGSGH